MILKAVIVLLVFLASYLIYKIFKTEKVNRVDISILNRFPDMEVNLKELAEKTWLKYDDVMYEKYVAAVESGFSASTTTSAEEPVTEEAREAEVAAYSFERDEVLASLWKDCVEPYFEEVERQDALELLVKGFNLLFEKGSCPSVSIRIKETEPEDTTETESYALYKDLLSKVTLREHTAHVVRYSVDSAKEFFQSPEVHVPKLITCAVFHDVGKIPEYRMIYNYQAHPFVSANVLSQLAGECQKRPFWLDEAIQIVKEHHLPGEQNVYKKILKKADKSARMLEISTKLSGYTLKSLDSWFDLEEFLKKVAGYVNDDRFGNKWYGFSYEGVVYLRPDRVIDVLEEMRREKKVISPELLNKEDHEKVIASLIKTMNDSDLIAYSTPERRIRKPQRFTILLKDGKSFTTYLIPLKITAFSESDRKVIEGKKAVSNLCNSIAGVKITK